MKLLTLSLLLALSSGIALGQDSSKEIHIDAAQLELIVNVSVASKEAGVVERLDVIEGKAVFAGDVLASLDSASYRAQELAAESELEIAKMESKNEVDLKYSKVSTDVSQKVYQRSLNATKQFAKSVSKTELERLRLEYERAKLSGDQAVNTQEVNKLNVELKEATLQLAEIRLKDRELASPASGMIAEVYRQPGEWVQPGDRIVRIIDTKKLRVLCRCAVADAMPNQVGPKAIFTTNSGKEYSATVTFVSPEVDPEVQDFLVWAEVDNKDGELFPGIQGTVKLQSK